MSDSRELDLKAHKYLKLLADDYTLSERSFAHFFQSAWPVLEPGRPYQHNWHIDCLCEHLEAVWSGEIRRLLVNMPPRHLKSNIVSIAFPAWAWIKQPEKRFFCASYSDRLSTSLNISRRDLIRSRWYQWAWSQAYQLKTDSDTKTLFENDKRGKMFSTSVGGSGTGEGGDYIIIDDPQNPKMAYSEQIRASVNRWRDQTVTTRKNDPKTSAEIIIMQRLHRNDLTGHVLEQDPDGWVHLKLEGQASKKHVVVFPRSGETKIREPGDLLFSEREGEKEHAEKRLELGTSGYLAQYGQDPTSDEGAIIKRAWTVKRWKALPSKFDQIIQSWDATFKDTQKADFVVGQVWGRSDADFYLIDEVRGRMDFVATCQAMTDFSAKHPKALLKLVEDKANGPAIIATLKTSVSGIVAVNPEGSKEARLSAVSPYFEAGNVWLPDPSVAAWVSDYVEELVSFPLGVHDDRVDATSQALLRFKDGLGEFSEEMIPKSNTIANFGSDSW